MISYDFPPKIGQKVWRSSASTPSLEAHSAPAVAAPSDGRACCAPSACSPGAAATTSAARALELTETGEGQEVSGVEARACELLEIKGLEGLEVDFERLKARLCPFYADYDYVIKAKLRVEGHTYMLATWKLFRPRV